MQSSQKGETSGMIYSSDRGPMMTHDDSDHFGQFYFRRIPVSFMLRPAAGRITTLFQDTAWMNIYMG